MIPSLPQFVLVAVMVVHSPFGPVQLEYQSVDYFKTWNQCMQQQRQLSQKQNRKTAHVCLKLDRD